MRSPAQPTAPHHRRRPLRRATTALCSACVLLVACTGESDASTGELVGEVTTAAATTTAASTSTTTSTSTTSTTTAAPTTTVDEESAVVAAVEQAYFDAFDAYHEAIQDPSNTELRRGLADHYVDRGLENVLGILDDLVELNAVAVENPEFGPARAEIIGPVRFENDERSEATIVVCEINSEWFVEPRSGPNGEDSVLRTQVIRVDLVVRFAEGSDGHWRSKSGGNSVELVGAESCD